MPPRLSSVSRTGNGFYPANDPATYRDLLLFEERLKTNASLLTRRKRRYQLFLAQLLLIIAFLLSEVLLQTDFLSIPYRWLLCRVLPDIYGPKTEIQVHRYFPLGLLCVSVTTLALFFLSGMYSEKIAYANKYVPHANRALRSFNMYLNVRQPPLQSKLPFNPFSFLFPRTSPSPSCPPSPTSPPSSRARSPSPARLSKRSSSIPISPIPPASNPRGELIFSSRVDRSFRESYERYRNAFERRREERERAAHETTWLGWVCTRVLRMKRASTVNGDVPRSGTTTPVGIGRTGSLAGSVRGRGSPAGTPTSSRRSSPVPPRVGRHSAFAGSGLRTSTPTADNSSQMSLLNVPTREQAHTEIQ